MTATGSKSFAGSYCREVLMVGTTVNSEEADASKV
ncbi:Uncharacterised protein [Bordetella pertussis]|nr:Uncharacterised protein [Bordetella pertussis]CFO75152.1 Uncharacterised protein [Bordetella pertussis]CFU84959.1 Uncharacterised protein [Bordetella pertussis]CFW29281.1 Uncharacterised protein [Bordetella pertussis]CPI20651.1 Uncharacterised protein [Bordetella pertussis]